MWRATRLSQPQYTTAGLAGIIRPVLQWIYDRYIPTVGSPTSWQCNISTATGLYSGISQLCNPVVRPHGRLRPRQRAPVPRTPDSWSNAMDRRQQDARRSGIWSASASLRLRRTCRSPPSCISVGVMALTTCSAGAGSAIATKSDL